MLRRDEERTIEHRNRDRDTIQPSWIDNSSSCTLPPSDVNSMVGEEHTKELRYSTPWLRREMGPPSIWICCVGCEERVVVNCKHNNSRNITLCDKCVKRGRPGSLNSEAVKVIRHFRRKLTGQFMAELYSVSPSVVSNVLLHRGCYW